MEPEQLFHPERSIVIVNPSSGRPLLRRRRDQLLKEMRLQGYTILETSARGHATALAAEAEARGKRGIIVVGGDGTLLEVAQGLTSQVALAHYPSGTINLLSLSLGVPPQPRAFLRLLRHGVLRPVFPGRAGTHRFFSVVSVGFDAAVVHALDKQFQLKRRLQEGAFAWVAFREIVRYEPPEFEVYLEGRRFPEPLLGVLVGKVPHFAGSRAIFPTITPLDPEFEVLLLTGTSKGSLFRYAAGLLTGKLAGMKGVVVQRVRELEIITRPPAPVEVDGEALGTTPLRLSVEEPGFYILAP